MGHSDEVFESAKQADISCRGGLACTRVTLVIRILRLAPTLFR